LRSFNPLLLMLNSPGDGQPHLLGSRCDSCGRFFFPQQSICMDCLKSGTLKEAPLGTKGTVYSYTIVERETLAPKGFKVPYAYGYIDLAEGVRVLSKIIDWTPETLKLGAPVEMVLEEIREDPPGEKVMGFRFRLLEGSRSKEDKK